MRCDALLGPLAFEQETQLFGALCKGEWTTRRPIVGEIISEQRGATSCNRDCDNRLNPAGLGYKVNA